MWNVSFFIQNSKLLCKGLVLNRFYG